MGTRSYRDVRMHLKTQKLKIFAIGQFRLVSLGGIKKSQLSPTFVSIFEGSKDIISVLSLNRIG